MLSKVCSKKRYTRYLIDVSCVSLCGATEIRTRDTLLGYTRFPGVPLQPLEHRSK